MFQAMTNKVLFPGFDLKYPENGCSPVRYLEDVMKILEIPNHRFVRKSSKSRELGFNALGEVPSLHCDGNNQVPLTFSRSMARADLKQSYARFSDSPTRLDNRRLGYLG